MYGFLRYIIDYPPARKRGLPKASVREAKNMRENLSEKSIDKTLENSFPASDPPSWY